MLLFFPAVLPVCVIHKRKFCHAQYNQMTNFETKNVFCINITVLVVECFFAKASH